MSLNLPREVESHDSRFRAFPPFSAPCAFVSRLLSKPCIKETGVANAPKTVAAE